MSFYEELRSTDEQSLANALNSVLAKTSADSFDESVEMVNAREENFPALTALFKVLLKQAEERTLLDPDFQAGRLEGALEVITAISEYALAEEARLELPTTSDLR